MGFKQPDQFGGPFPSLLYLFGISEPEGLRQGLNRKGAELPGNVAQPPYPGQDGISVILDNLRLFPNQRLDGGP